MLLILMSILFGILFANTLPEVKYIFKFIKKGKAMHRNDTHRKSIGYVLWIFGFIGAHRFYYGKPISGTLYFFTLGLLGIGWLVDFFLIPSMDEEADLRYFSGDIDYSLAFIFLTFLGIFGVHRMYMGKWISGLLYLVTGGVFGIGVLCDFWTLNDQVSMKNRRVTVA